MSLYSLQKLIYHLNRDPRVQATFRAGGAGRDALVDGYELSAEERGAVDRDDVGLLYVLGVNGQLLMHFAAFVGLEWPEYLDAMRRGVATHGPVRAGIYAMTTDAPQAAMTAGGVPTRQEVR